MKGVMDDENNKQMGVSTKNKTAKDDRTRPRPASPALLICLLVPSARISTETPFVMTCIENPDAHIKEHKVKEHQRK
jgi:hypothetical protein